MCPPRCRSAHGAHRDPCGPGRANVPGHSTLSGPHGFPWLPAAFPWFGHAAGTLGAAWRARRETTDDQVSGADWGLCVARVTRIELALRSWESPANKGYPVLINCNGRGRQPRYPPAASGQSPAVRPGPAPPPAAGHRPSHHAQHPGTLYCALGRRSVPGVDMPTAQPAWPIAPRSMATVVAAALRSASSSVVRTRSSRSTTAAWSTPIRTGTLCIPASTAAACSAGVAVAACGMRVVMPRPSARSRGG